MSSVISLDEKGLGKGGFQMTNKKPLTIERLKGLE
jgi:hypothetical protein